MKSLWDRKAKIYGIRQRIFPFHFILKQELNNLAELIAQIPSPEPILDLATGPGTVLHLFSPETDIVGLDRSAVMLKKTKRHSQPKLIRADALALPFRPNTFQLVIAAGVLEYQRSWTDLLKEIAAVLKSGGFTIVTYSPPNPLNYFRLLLGHRIFLKTEVQAEFLVKKAEFTCLTKMKSLIQKQMLLKFQPKQ